MKRWLGVLVCLSLILILSLTFVSAGFFSDIWNKITGKVVGATCIGTLSCSSLTSQYSGTTLYTIYNGNAALRAGCSCTCASGSCSSCSNIYSACSSFTTSQGCMLGTGCTWSSCTVGDSCGSTIVFRCTNQQILQTVTPYTYDSSCSCVAGSANNPVVYNNCNVLYDNWYCTEGQSNTVPISCTACSPACTFAYATATCGAGNTCTINSCSANYLNCDGIITNGCEQSTAVSSGTLTSCSAVSCSSGYLNCDGIITNGCEQSTAVSSGTLTSCSAVSCSSGYLNCDGIITNGCEQSTAV
ncbi:MAG: hypothetical protein AABY32_02845, partial [Nanoarchaeota archaeon]